MGEEEKKYEVKGIDLGEEELWPSMKKYFEDDQKFRVIALLSGETLTSFRKAVEKEYGSFFPYECKMAVNEAIKEWIKRKVG